MQIVIDKESLITLFTVAFYAICGGDYIDVKNTVIELLDKVGYTPLPKGHGRLIDADAMFKDICNSIEEMTNIGIAVGSQYLWEKINDAIYNASTIIEAERSDEE